MKTIITIAFLLCSIGVSAQTKIVDALSNRGFWLIFLGVLIGMFVGALLEKSKLNK